MSPAALMRGFDMILATMGVSSRLVIDEVLAVAAIYDDNEVDGVPRSCLGAAPHSPTRHIPSPIRRSHRLVRRSHRLIKRSCRLT